MLFYVLGMLEREVEFGGDAGLEEHLCDGCDGGEGDHDEPEDDDKDGSKEAEADVGDPESVRTIHADGGRPSAEDGDSDEEGDHVDDHDDGRDNHLEQEVGYHQAPERFPPTVQNHGVRLFERRHAASGFIDHDQGRLGNRDPEPNVESDHAKNEQGCKQPGGHVITQNEARNHDENPGKEDGNTREDAYPQEARHIRERGSFRYGTGVAMCIREHVLHDRDGCPDHYDDHGDIADHDHDDIERSRIALRAKHE